jgi:DNA polymerase
MGEPFVGPSGKVFEEALNRIVGLKREDLYITNTVKCYTKNNRKPMQSEVDNCRDFLDLEMKLVQPKVAVALGSFAFKALTGMSGIMKHCGEVVISPRYRIRVVAMLHPSPYNTNNPERKKMFELAMKKLAEVLRDE